jgi:hypothetical protein
MAQHHRITHAYSYPTGWVRVPHQQLTPELTGELLLQGYTMARVRRGWFGQREVSLRQPSARR